MKEPFCIHHQITKQFPGLVPRVHTQCICKQGTQASSLHINDGNLLRAIAAKFRFCCHIGVSFPITVNRPHHKSQQQHNFTITCRSKLNWSIVSTIVTMSNAQKAARWSNELGWVASATTGSKPTSQPAGGDRDRPTPPGRWRRCGGTVRRAVPKKPISQVAGPTRHISPNQRGILDLDLRS